MRLLAFDTETFLITDTDSAPKPVCCTWYDGENRSITHPSEMRTAVIFADPSILYVGQNIAYDLVLMMRWHPHLIPDIIRALDEGRVFDTQMRERMMHLSTIGGKGYPMFISLADLTLKYLKIDISADKKGDDIWRLKYGTLDGVPFREWPSEALRYAMDDAFHTYGVFQAQGGVSNIQPTEQMQVQASVVLQAIGVWGFAVNPDIRNRIGASLEVKAKALHEEIDKYQWTGTGSQKRMQDLVCSAWQTKHLRALKDRASVTGVMINETEWATGLGAQDVREMLKAAVESGKPPAGLYVAQDVDWVAWCKEAVKGLPEAPMTKKGYSTAGETLEGLMDIVPQFQTYMDLKHVEKMLENYVFPYKYPTAHPRFVPLVSTGRTGCRGGGSSSNMQNIPRKDKDRPEEAFRTMFKARKGRVLGTTDYSQLELCTLAATIRVFYPEYPCALGDAIDNGMDVHCITGGLFSGLSYEQMLAGKKAKDPTILRYRQSAKACFSGDTELLTADGWIRIDSLYGSDTPIIQYNPHNKEMTFAEPIAWIRKEDEIVNLSTTHMDQAVTPDHRLLFVSRVGVVREVLAGDIGKLDLGGNNWSSVHGGYLKKESDIGDLRTRLSVMVQADGSFSFNQVRLGFTKARKITRCRTLLQKAGIPFTESITNQGVTTFVASKGDWFVLTDNKTFVDDWQVYHPDAFCDELFRWDGHVAKKHHTSYGSAIKHNIDVAQAVLSTNGYKTCYHMEPACGNKQMFHKVEWYIGDRKKNTAYHRFGGVDVKAGLPQTVYCLAVPTSWVLTRRNGRVVVSGNCNFGKPGGLGVPAMVAYAKNNYGVTMSIDEMRKLDNAWKRAWPEVPNKYLKTNLDLIASSPTDSFTAHTITGRDKAECIYTEGSNFSFQGLAADGAKAAMWGIWREEMLGWYWSRHAGQGYGWQFRDSPLRESRIVNFVHDEIVGEHPEGDLGKAALARQDAIMVSEMTRICQNKIKISVESQLSDAWEH